MNNPEVEIEIILSANWKRFQSLQQQYKQIMNNLGECLIVKQLRDLVLRSKFAIENYSFDEAKEFMDRLEDLIAPVKNEVMKMIKDNETVPEAVVDVLHSEGYENYEQCQNSIIAFQVKA